MKNRKEKKEFSKVLLIQESILIWIMTLCFIGLAYICIINEYIGELPWLAAMVAFPWTAYGTSAGFYYNKSKKENCKGGIKYDSIMQENYEELITNNLDLEDENYNIATMNNIIDKENRSC